MISKTYMICNAYEAGFGKGQELSRDQNPYDPQTEYWEAWDIGYRTGRNRKLEAAASLHDDKGYEVGTAEGQAKADILRHDPCRSCRPGSVCRTPSCGRLKLPLDHPLRTISYWNKQ